jgi:hypothetical protein
MSGTHYKEVCQYGMVHAQCRCPSPTKAIHHITCDRELEHAKYAENDMGEVIKTEFEPQYRTQGIWRRIGIFMHETPERAWERANFHRDQLSQLGTPPRDEDFRVLRITTSLVPRMKEASIT